MIHISSFLAKYILKYVHIRSSIIGIAQGTFKDGDLCPFWWEGASADFLATLQDWYLSHYMIDRGARCLNNQGKHARCIGHRRWGSAARLTRLDIQPGADSVLAAGECTGGHGGIRASAQWCYHLEADALFGGSICSIVRLNGPTVVLFRCSWRPSKSLPASFWKQCWKSYLPCPKYESHAIGGSFFQTEVLFYPSARFLQSSLPPHSLLSHPTLSLEEATNAAARAAIRYMASVVNNVLIDYSYA